MQRDSSVFWEGKGPKLTRGRNCLVRARKSRNGGGEGWYKKPRYIHHFTFLERDSLGSDVIIRGEECGFKRSSMEVS